MRLLQAAVVEAASAAAEVGRECGGLGSHIQTCSSTLLRYMERDDCVGILGRETADAARLSRAEVRWATASFPSSTLVMLPRRPWWGRGVQVPVSLSSVAARLPSALLRWCSSICEQVHGSIHGYLRMPATVCLCDCVAARCLRRPAANSLRTSAAEPSDTRR